MALSQTVDESLNDASASLRNALAYAARNERPHVCEAIAKILADVEKVAIADNLFDSLEDMKKNPPNGGNPFGNLGF